MEAYWAVELFDSTQSGQRPVVSLEDVMTIAVLARGYVEALMIGGPRVRWRD
jgi:hypothetical protein